MTDVGEFCIHQPRHPSIETCTDPLPWDRPATVLPFLPEFVPLIQSGRKTMTCRSKRYVGPQGGMVDSPAGVLHVHYVERVSLGFVRRHLWEKEGCQSGQDFEDIWRRIHPRAGFKADTKVWLHVFDMASQGLFKPDRPPANGGAP